MRPKNSSHATESTMPSRDITVAIRMDEALKDRLENIAARFTKRRNSRVTLAAVIRQTIAYGIELLEDESLGYILSESKRMTESEHLLAVAEEACKIGFEHLRNLSLGQNVSDTVGPDGP